MARNLFDHLKGVTKDKVKWDSLSEEDQKTWNNFLISRWFSMEMDLIDAINEFQKYTNGGMTSGDYYRLLYDCLPKQSFFLKYIKRKNKVEIDNKFIDLFCRHYECSRRKFYEIMRDLVKYNPEELTSVLKMYGTLPADIELFEKQLKTLK